MGLLRLLLLSVLCCVLSQLVLAQEVALTFEKLPAMKPYGYFIPRELSNLILRELEKENIQSIGFVVGEKIDDDPSSYIVLQDWISHGHLLGNNTYSYVDLNRLTADDFVDHIKEGQKYIRQASKGVHASYRNFRYPLLHEGNSKGKKNEVAKILHHAGYTVVPVTIKTADFAFNWAFEENQTNPDELDRLKVFYLDHIRKAIEYAESQSQLVFGRQIRHILQLQVGLATAHYLEGVIQLLQEKGYHFITVSEALEDSAYQTEEQYIGPDRIGFIDRVAATRGLPYDPDQGEISRKKVRELMEGSATVGRMDSPPAVGTTPGP